MTNLRNRGQTYAAPAVPCRACAVRDDCDGIPGQGEIFGCYMHHVGTDTCRVRGWTCPCNPDYLDRWRQAKTRPGQARPFRGLNGVPGPLPAYVPVVHSSRYRAGAFDYEAVAVPMQYALRRSDGRYAPASDDALSFRQQFGLSDDTQVLVVGVGKDPTIERYWQHRNAARVPEAFARLRLVGVTCPNYSFFSDVPRTHTLWNRARMQLCLEELSDAGVRVVPHLNAATESDWRFWGAFLKASPSMAMVAKEFQTGNSRCEVGTAALTRMRRLQDEVGRRLHPVLVGGAQFIEEVAEAFESFTIVDATPYMKALKRQMVWRVSEVSVDWRSMPSPRNEPLDGLFEHNLTVYAAALNARIRVARGLPLEAVQAELALPLSHDRT